MERFFNIWFSKINISNSLKLKILDKYTSPEMIWALKENELEEIGLKEKAIKEILDKNTRKQAEEEEKFILNNGIYVINCKEKIYPEKLKKIKNTPAVLYAIGNYSLLNEKSVAIIGSRLPSNYGKKIAIEAGREMSNNGIAVVSGLAKRN